MGRFRDTRPAPRYLVKVVVGHHPGSAKRRILACVGFSASLCAGCSPENAIHRGEGDEYTRGELASANPDPQRAQLGRIHVLMQPNRDRLEPEPELQVQARFVEYRGVEEDFVRSRANLSRLEARLLSTGECVPSTSLRHDSEDDPYAGEEEPRELSFVDVGDIRLLIGEHERLIPMVLVPDILPYVSGVEYLHADDSALTPSVTPDGRTPVSLLIDGRRSTTVNAPQPIHLDEVKVDRGNLTLRWAPPGSSTDNLTLRLQAFRDGAPIGEEVLCAVPDSGQAELSDSDLRAAGLGTDTGQLLRVAAARIESGYTQIARFGAVELVVEMRTQSVVSLRP